MLARLYQLFKFRSFVFRQLNVCMLAHARSMAEDEENNNLFVYGALERFLDVFAERMPEGDVRQDVASDWPYWVGYFVPPPLP
jgi:hypothetical protein